MRHNHGVNLANFTMKSVFNYHLTGHTDGISRNDGLSFIDLFLEFFFKHGKHKKSLKIWREKKNGEGTKGNLQGELAHTQRGAS